MKNKEFLEFLDEPEIIAKIREIAGSGDKRQDRAGINGFLRISEKKADEKAVIDNMQKNIRILKDKNENLEKDNRQLQGWLEAAEDKLAEEQAQNRAYADNCRKLAYGKEQLEKELSAEKGRYTELETAYKSAGRNLTSMREKCENLAEENSRLRKALADVQKQLQERFAEGWELYRQYLQVDGSSRQVLTSVFPGTSFESFICGGAKDKSLEKIWDETERNLKNGATEYAGLLWRIFVYFMHLVNASKTDYGYELLDVKTGDPYSRNCHSLDNNSRVQGKVGKVWLYGFRNIYNNEIIRKSRVHVE